MMGQNILRGANERLGGAKNILNNNSENFRGQDCCQGAVAGLNQHIKELRRLLRVRFLQSKSC